MQPLQNRHVHFVRDCDATMVPDGTHTTIAAGMEARITQALGGSITIVTQYGQMFRLEGKDADAVGLEPKDFPGAQRAAGGTLEDHVWAELATCYDPEIPVNIVDLGLVYHCAVDEIAGENVASVKMTLTAPGCGMGEILTQDVREKIELIQTVERADVELVFDPPWNQSMMSEEARLEAGLL